jgi:hypothetical protein
MYELMGHKLKSAVVIDKPEAILKALESRTSLDGGTRLVKDGGSGAHLTLRKAVGRAVGGPAALEPGTPSVLRGAVEGTSPTATQLQKLVEARGMDWRDEYVQRAIPYWASDERVDNMGDIVRQNWDFKQFEQNSPMPYSHNWMQPPVGRVVDWEVMQRKGDYAGPALALLGVFATKEDWEWADTVFRLVKNRFLVAGSVGFYPKTIIHVTDAAERQKLGLGQYGYVLDDNTLLEYSPTTLPANPGAVVLNSLRTNKGDTTVRDIHFLRELLRLDTVGRKDAKSRWGEYETALLSVARAIFPKSRFEYHSELDVPVLLDAPLPGEEEQTTTPSAEPQANTPAMDAEAASKMLTEVHTMLRQQSTYIGSMSTMLKSSLQQQAGVMDMLEELGASRPADPNADPAADDGDGPDDEADPADAQDDQDQQDDGDGSDSEDQADDQEDPPKKKPKPKPGKGKKPFPPKKSGGLGYSVLEALATKLAPDSSPAT